MLQWGHSVCVGPHLQVWHMSSITFVIYRHEQRMQTLDFIQSQDISKTSLKPNRTDDETDVNIQGYIFT